MFAKSLFLSTAILLSATEKRDEEYYTKIVATNIKGSAIELVLPDESRIDIIDNEHAYEVDWAYKWKEAIGQSLFYSLSSNRKPGIVLLTSNKGTDKIFYLRCLSVCTKHNIKLVTYNIDNGKLIGLE